MSQTCCEFHVGDVGAKVGLHFVTCDGRYDTDLDVSDATLTFTFRAESGDLTVIEHDSIVAADFDGATEDKTDGRVMYVTVPGFFTEVGHMQLQGHAEWDDGRRHSTTVVRFHVGPKLGASVEVVSWEDGDLMTWENGDLIAWENGT